MSKMFDILTVLQETLELAKEYQTNERDCIESPGKFEGEHISTLYFYDAMLNGGGREDCDDESMVTFDVEPHEALAFSEPNAKGFLITILDTGFVCGEFI